MARKNNGAADSIEKINRGYETRVNYMATNYSQVTAAHLIVTWPDDIDHTHANTELGESLNALRKTLRNKGVESQAGWVREVAPEREDDKPHYHIGLLCNGREIQSGMGHARHLNRLLTKRWGKSEESVFVKCQPPNPDLDCQVELNSRSSAIKLRSLRENAEAQKDNILDWFSYHAKAETKGNVPPRIREYGFSQLPKQPQRAQIENPAAAVHPKGIDSEAE